MNAFVLPGGKVFVHSGILRATRTEAGLAAVLGHEIAHNMASHVGERMSGSIGINILLYSFYALSYAIPGGIFLIHSLGGGLLDMVFSMPMSRMQESEADYIGLMLMAEACYDPREAVGFWQRMEAASRSQGEEVPELMSTHPSNQHRIEKIQSWLPQALEKFQISDCQGTSAFADAFRRALERGTQFQTIYM
ncbi:Oryzin [Verticillium dahliae VDG1]|nr:Exosome complex component rrp43 [Verticillium dahliae VDG2]KAF3353568.1 Oryzin [Verticillium dahliae VDG1]